MKNFGDVFQLSQRGQPFQIGRSLRLILCTSPVRAGGLDTGAGAVRSSLMKFHGGVKDQMLPYIIGAIIGIVIGLAVGIPVGIQRRKKSAEQQIGSAEEEATRIVNEAYKSAESKKREAMVEAKEEILKAKNEHEREVKERRADLQRQEHRLQQKEENLDRKTENIEKKEEQLSSKLSRLEATQAEAEQIKKSQLEVLERISGYTAEEAKHYLLQQLEEEVTHESAMKIKEIEARFKDEADTKAREIISLAIQRCAADHVAEATVSVVPLPNDEMKGRIIGREGRNIRTLETLTGVDLIIDDTPEAITVSCFDPVRREVARLALEKLILDGRIHPARIEEMVEKAKREVDAVIKSEGERAIFETNVHGLHPELEGSHVQIGVELAKKYRESEGVIHAIQAHHNDVEPRTVVACLVQAADAISAARPGARRENLENYIKRLEMLEEITSSFNGVEKSFAIQAGREVRIMVKPEVISEDQMVLLAREIAKKIEDELEYPGQIKVNLLRETKAIEYAK